MQDRKNNTISANLHKEEIIFQHRYASLHTFIEKIIYTAQSCSIALKNFSALLQYCLPIPKKLSTCLQPCKQAIQKFGIPLQGCKPNMENSNTLLYGCRPLLKKFGVPLQGYRTMPENFGMVKQGCYTVPKFSGTMQHIEKQQFNY